MLESNVFNSDEGTYVLDISTQVTLTDEDIDDIMTSALEGGINYWCSKFEIVEEGISEYANEQISQNGSLNLYTVDDDKVYELTREKFLNGVKMFLEQQAFSSYQDRQDNTLGLDVGMIDSIYADLIIQYALFSDIIYG